jgi:hypothetical protein
VQDCVTTEPEKLSAEMKETCEQGQALLPAEDKIPVIDGSAVSVTPEVQDLRFATEDGALLAIGKVVPLTRDPRVAKDLRKGKEMGPPFYILLVKNRGSVRMPPFASFLIFGGLLAFHLVGLNRAEKQKLSPVA